jgi:hypothetical protein
VESFVGNELELIMLVLIVFFKRKKVNFIEEGWGVSHITKHKFMVDLEIKVVLLDIIVKEGVILFKKDAKGDKLFVIGGPHNIFKKHTV